MKTPLIIVATSLLVLAGCANFSQTTIPAPKATYQAMTCSDLNTAFETEREATMDLFDQPKDNAQKPTAAEEEDTDKKADKAVWENMINTSIETIQNLFDGFSASSQKPDANALAVQRGKIIAIEDVAVEKFCSGLLEQLTVYRVEMRKKLS